MKKLFLLCALLLSASICANAHPMDSGPFNLPGGVIPPKSQHPGLLRIPLTSLPLDAVAFDITCDIENPNYNKAYPAVIRFYNGTLDGVASSSNQYLLNHQISKFATRWLRLSRDLMFENYDTVDSVFVKNCMAVYATS